MNVLMEEAHETGSHTLKKTLGAGGLIALGIGAIIGAGLYVDNEVGAVVADRIIGARPFESIEQLRSVDGINDSLFEALRDRVSLD